MGSLNNRIHPAWLQVKISNGRANTCARFAVSMRMLLVGMIEEAGEPGDRWPRCEARREESPDTDLPSAARAVLEWVTLQPLCAASGQRATRLVTPGDRQHDSAADHGQCHRE